MTLQITKKIAAAAAVLLIAAGLFFGIEAVVRKNGYHTETYQVKGGWGYSIYYGKKEVIHQPFIPVISGKHPFATRHDAAKTGKMVLKKLQHGELPSLTYEDLLKAGIITQGTKP